MKNLLTFLLGTFLLLGTTIITVSAFDQSDLDRMKEHGLTIYGDMNQFGAERKITRGESSRFVVSYARTVGLGFKVNDNCSFNDIAGYDSTLERTIEYACEYGLIRGSNGSYFPKNNLTEAEALTIAIRTVEGMQNELQQPWYRDYYTLGKEYGLVKNESMYEMGYTDITRAKFGEWLVKLGKLHQSESLVKSTFTDTIKKPIKEVVTLGIETINIYSRGLDGMSDGEESYVFRLKPSIKKGEPENMVIQTKIEKNYCLELPQNNLPEYFTYVSVNNGNTWKSKASAKRATEYYDYYNDFICGPFLIKVEYPKDRTIFDDGIVFPIVKKNRYDSSCHNFVISADNAQYEEVELCY